MATDPLFSALASPVRRRLLELLADGPRNVSSLAGEFDMSRPSVSEHLQILRNTGLVTEVSSGRQRIYSLNAGPLREIGDWLHPFERYWRNQLSKLSELLEEQ